MPIAIDGRKLTGIPSLPSLPSSEKTVSKPSGSAKTKNADQREGDRQPLLLTAGQLRELGLEDLGQPELPEQLGRVPRRRVERRIQLERLAGPDLVRQLTRLQLDADQRGDLGTPGARVEAEHLDRTGIR